MAPAIFRTAVLTVGICSAVAPPVAAAAVRHVSVSESVIDRIVEAGRSELHLPGVSLGIMRGDRVLLAKGYGFADLQTRQKATEQTIYPIGSLSKQFTAAAVMKLVQQHRIRLQQPVTTYLPEYHSPDTPPPTIEQLLRQTSGIPAWDELPELQDESDVNRFTLPNLVQTLAQHHAAYRAGDWWSYSNSNYMLLARVIERVTKQPFDEYLLHSFFVPLGLSSTSECLSLPAATAAKSGFASGYLFDNGGYTPRAMRPATRIGMAGAGGLCSNAMDLLRWSRALAQGRAVGAAAFRQMTKPTPVRSGFTAPYGFGLSLLPFAGQRAIWHTGVMAGYISVLVYLPDQDVTIAALTNSRHVSLHSMVKRVAETMIGSKPRQVRNRVIPQREASRAVGNYDDHMFKFRVYRRGQQLYVDVPELGSPLRLLYQGDHRFMTAEPQAFRFKFLPDTGPVQRVDWEWTELRAFAQPVH